MYVWKRVLNTMYVYVCSIHGHDLSLKSNPDLMVGLWCLEQGGQVNEQSVVSTCH